MKGEVSDILIARHYRLKQLPGLLRRYLAVGEKEYGLVLRLGQIMRVLPPSRKGIVHYAIGWAFPGLDRRSAVRLRAMDVHIHPTLSRVASGDELPVPLDASLSATVEVADVVQFYTSLVEGREQYWASDLANEVAVSLKPQIQKLLLWYDAQTLCLDEGGAVSARLAQELAPTVQEFLASRGANLKSLSILRFSSSEAKDRLVQEVEALKEQVAQGKAQVGAVLEEVAKVLEAHGLVTPEEVEKLKTALAASLPQAQMILGQLLERFYQWREEQLQRRAAQLAIPEKTGQEKGSAKKGRGWLAIFIYPVLALAIGGVSVYLYWFRFSKLIANIDLGTGHIIAGASLLALVGVAILVVMQVVLDRVLHFIISKIKESILSQREKKPKATGMPTPALPLPSQEPAPPVPETKAPGRLDAWLTQESLKADENIRRHVAREISQAIGNLNEARYRAHRGDGKDLAQALKSLADEAEAFRVRVEGAPYYSSVIAPHRGQVQVKAGQLISFEEDLLGQARVFRMDSEKLLALVQENPAEANLQVKTIVANLRQLKHLFSQRDTIFDGLAVPSRAAS